MSARLQRDHAVVIGGSVAGLLTARVLSAHFARVTVVERDRLPLDVENRRGVPQGRHTHALLAGGRKAIERLFPKIDLQLFAAGAIEGDASADTHWLFEGDCLAPGRSGIQGMAVSRALLETTIRQRVKALENVEFREGIQVDGLTLAAAGDKITGLLAGGTQILADLVVDASGRGSKMPKWLAGLGFEPAAEETVAVGIGYTTRRFKREPGQLEGKIAAVIPSTPEGKRGGVILAQEGGEWIVTLFSNFGNYAPEDLDGFIEAARQLPASFIYDVICDARPVGEPVSTRFPASRRRRYERLRRWPAGVLVLGDGICSFNPIYGQGMTSAALQAAELDAELGRGGRAIERRFFRRAAKVVDTPWAIAVGNDLRMPEVEAPRPAMTRFVNWYMAKLHKAAHRDARLGAAFLRVTNLLAPPTSVLRPDVALRVLVGNLRCAVASADRDLRVLRAATNGSGR